MGQVVGDGAAVIQGTGEVAGGGGGLVGGTALIGTGAGAPVGIAVDYGSVALGIHGVAVGGTGARNLGKAFAATFSSESGNGSSPPADPGENGMKPGSAGGPGAGKKTTPLQRKQTLQQNGGRCVVPGCTQPAVHTDHAIPRSRNNDTTNENVQGMCAHHNCQKGGKTSEEYADWLKGAFGGEQITNEFHQYC